MDSLSGFTIASEIRKTLKESQFLLKVDRPCVFKNSFFFFFSDLEGLHFE